MKRLFASLFARSPKPAAGASSVVAPAPAEVIQSPGIEDLRYADLIRYEHGFPYPDWNTVFGWLDRIESDAAREAAWSACRYAWIEYFRAALGDRFSLLSQDGTLILSPLPPNEAKAALAYVVRKRRHIVELLEGVAAHSPLDGDVLVVLEDEESYYRYVSAFYDEEGEFAMSGGMFLNQGCKHFVLVQADLTVIEPIIVHELTHACLSHLQLPRWLDEGLAVNTEFRLCRVPHPEFTPAEMRAMHREFWNADTIQEFWSGDAFYRPDNGNRLSYDLAQGLVQQLGSDWATFRAFALAARYDDAGAASAQEHFKIDLGEHVKSVMQLGDDVSWAPRVRAGCS
jgi:hypothetical protein